MHDLSDLRSKIYFLSDFHLGIDTKHSSRVREKMIVAFLDSIKDQASEIFLVGDVFDFWFEYAKVVPKGYIRLFGKLAELADFGIKFHYFIGNHDMWMFDYLKDEIGAEMHKEPIKIERQGKKIIVGHGDGLGPGDHGYKFIKKIFANKICQWLFARIHPNGAMAIAEFWSRRSRNLQKVPRPWQGEDEWLVQYCRDFLKENHVDFFIFGHRHIPQDHDLKDRGSRYINLGDWMQYFSFVEMSGGAMNLRYFKQD